MAYACQYCVVMNNDHASRRNGEVRRGKKEEAPTIERRAQDGQVDKDGRIYTVSSLRPFKIKCYTCNYLYTVLDVRTLTLVSKYLLMHVNMAPVSVLYLLNNSIECKAITVLTAFQITTRSLHLSSMPCLLLNSNGSSFTAKWCVRPAAALTPR